MKVCSFDGCLNKHWAKGLCQGHHVMKNRTGELKPLRVTARTKTYAEQKARYEEGLAEHKPNYLGPCSVEDCDRQSNVSNVQLCSAHYQQVRVGKEPTPIRPYSPRQAADSKTRTCTTCLRVKNTREDFYLRNKSTTPQATCKVCLRYLSRFTFLRRQGRAAEEQAVLAAWTAYVRLENKEWEYLPPPNKSVDLNVPIESKEWDSLGHDYEVEE